MFAIFLPQRIHKPHNFTNNIQTTTPLKYFPDSFEVNNIIDSDNGASDSVDKYEYAIQALEKLGDPESLKSAQRLKLKMEGSNSSMNTYHYLPYKSDSNFEKEYLNAVLTIDDFNIRNLEIYYNGDRALSDFHIRCFKKTNNKWQYVGRYTPDFLILQRKDDHIFKIVIVETKGQVYSELSAFEDRRAFIENTFLKENNNEFGYKKFDYLYIEDSLSQDEYLARTREKIIEFFDEE